MKKALASCRAFIAKPFCIGDSEPDLVSGYLVPTGSTAFTGVVGFILS